MNLKLLLVENDQIDQMAFKRLVKQQQLPYTYIIAESIAQAREILLTQDRFDFVLLDYHLDDGTSFELLDMLSNIPTIFLTGTGNEEIAVQAMKAGAFDYLIKDAERQYLKVLPVTVETVLKQYQAQEQFRILSHTIKSINEGVYITDLADRIILVNAAFCKTYNYAEHEILGQQRQILWPTEADMHPALSSLMAEGYDAEIYHQSKDGLLFPVSVSESIIRDNQGQAIAIAGVVRDISERKHAEEKLRQFNLQLQAQNEELDAFAHTVAHDLKGPLNAIIGFSELLESSFDTLSAEVLQTHLQTIARKGRGLSRIIDELLLLAGVRKKNISPKTLDMGQICASVLERLTYMIEDYQPEIIMPPSWPVALGYAPWIAEVWANYISNALKYGGVAPQVELGADPQSEGMIRFWVRDNGPGLSPEEQANLFTPFTRLNQVRVEGHGLGLSIVQRIVEKLGGQVSLESDNIPGQGCRFSFTLPAVAEDKRVKH